MMKFAVGLGWVALAVCASGCALSSENAAGNATAAATTRGFSYTCTAPGNDGDDVEFTIDARHETATLDGGEGTRTANYHPRAGSGLEGYHLYEGFPSDEGATSVVVHPSIEAGHPAAKEDAPAGHIRIQNRGEGFEAIRYYCTVK
jgi:hypothetical protein